MRSLIQWGIKQGVLLNITFFGLVLFGAFVALPSLPVDRYPNIEFGEVRMGVNYPGASSEEVEQLVTREIEESLRGMQDIEFIRATSIAGTSTITVKFVDDTDYASLYEELRLRVLGVQSRMPVVNGKPLAPTFDVVNVDEWLPVMQVNLITGDPERPLDTRALTLLAEDLRTRLQAIPDIKEVKLLGDEPQQFMVALHPNALEAHRITAPEVVQALRRSGAAPPAGSIDTVVGERQVRVDNRFRSRDDISEVIVRRDGDGRYLRIADLIDHDETGIESIPGAIISSVNGLDTVTVKVIKQRGANAMDVKAAVDEITAEFLAANADVSVRALTTMDGTREIKDGIGVLTSSLLLSVVLVMLCLFIFMAHRGPRLTWAGIILGLVAALVVAATDDRMINGIAIGVLTLFIFITCRAAVLTVAGIAFSFLGSLIVFELLDISINEISLLGFVLVCGIIVDDAIIVLENIQRHREQGKDLLPAVVDGATEVFWPIVSATLTTVAAFLPMLIMTGAVGEFFSLVPKAVAIALMISLIECLLILPLHVLDLERLFGRDSSMASSDERADPLARPGIMGTLSRLYDRALKWNLRHPFITMGAALGLFACAVGILVWSVIAPLHGYKPPLKLKFFPDDQTLVNVFIEMPDGTPIATTDATVRAISAQLADFGPGFVHAATGLAGMQVDLNYRPEWSNQYGFIMLELPAKERREFSDPKPLLERMRSELAERYDGTGIKVRVIQAQGGPPVGMPVNIRVTGAADEAVMRTTEDLLAALRQAAEPGGPLEGVIELQHDRSLTARVLAFEADRDAIARYDLPEDAVHQFVADMINGAYIGDYRRSDGDIPVRVRLRQGEFADPFELMSVPMVNQPNGRIIRFADIGSVDFIEEPAALARRDFQRTVTITGNISESATISPQAVSRFADQWFQQRLQDYPGVAIAFGGEAESTARSYRSLAIAFVIAILLIYAILAAQFNSYIQPILIMSNIVFSFTGVVLVMAAFGFAVELLPEGMVIAERSWFTVQSFIAIIGLAGLVINDAIVLIDFINQRRREGLRLEDELLVAGHQRMRPIVMTTVTTIAGLIPMAIGIPDFSITWGPFATCFIAGLSVSTAMTLLMVPVLYQQVDHVSVFVRRLHAAHVEQREHHRNPEPDSPRVSAASTDGSAHGTTEPDDTVDPTPTEDRHVSSLP